MMFHGSKDEGFLDVFGDGIQYNGHREAKA